ncbi:MAG: type 1 glutamine amidotransferase [Bdellovibrionales bacterium]|nr:type 1 glutamine amidotransferase [Bdellovibrionales bacterium]
MAKKLNGKKIAILSTDGFEQSELFEPRKALIEAGAEVTVVSLHGGEIKGWHEGNWGKSIKVDALVSESDSDQFDALMIPGGVMNPDKLRCDENVIEFIEGFFHNAKPVAAICHAPAVLIETGLVAGKTLTSWRSIKTDLLNAGATWVDKEVVSDEGLVTSRKPADIPAFNRKMIEVFAEGIPDIHPQRPLNH